MRSFALGLPLLLVAACSTASSRPDTLANCDTCDASMRSPGGGSGGGGGGNGGGVDAGSSTDAAAAGDGAVRFEALRGDGGVALTGRLRVAQSLPLTDSTPLAAVAGWNLETFPASLGETATTDAAGNFRFANASFITVNGTGPVLGLRMQGPRAGALATFMLLPPTSSVELVAIDPVAMQDALSAAMGTVIPSRGHLIVHVVSEGSPSGPLDNTVVTVVNAPVSQTYYDGPTAGQLVLSVTGTGAQGFAVIPNLDAPAAPGYFVAHVRLTRNGVSTNYSAPVFTDTITRFRLSPRS